jgi:hypothetical protein
MPRGPKGKKQPADVIGAADLAEMVDEALPKPSKHGPYKNELQHKRHAAVWH